MNAISADIKFCGGTVKKFAPDIRREFQQTGRVAHIVKRWTESGQISYEIRYRRNGVNITACGFPLKEVKQKFIALCI